MPRSAWSGNRARVRATSADLQISEIPGAKEGNVETHRAVWAPRGPGCKKEGHCLRERTPAVPNLQSRRMQYQSVHEVASVWGVGEEVNLMVRAFASESASHEITRSFTQVASAPGLTGHLTSGRHPDRLRGSPSRSFTEKRSARAPRRVAAGQRGAGETV